MTQVLVNTENTITILISDDQGDSVTGLTDADATAHYRKAGEAVETKTLDGTNFVEVDATEMPGFYEVTFTASELDTEGEFVAILKPDGGATFENATIRLEVSSATLDTIGEDTTNLLEAINFSDDKTTSHFVSGQDYVLPVKILSADGEGTPITGVPAGPSLVVKVLNAEDGGITQYNPSSNQWQEADNSLFPGVYLLTVPGSLLQQEGEVLISVGGGIDWSNVFEFTGSPSFGGVESNTFDDLPENVWIAKADAILTSSDGGQTFETFADEPGFSQQAFYTDITGATPDALFLVGAGQNLVFSKYTEAGGWADINEVAAVDLDDAFVSVASNNNNAEAFMVGALSSEGVVYRWSTTHGFSEIDIYEDQTQSTLATSVPVLNTIYKEPGSFSNSFIVVGNTGTILIEDGNLASSDPDGFYLASTVPTSANLYGVGGSEGDWYVGGENVLLQNSVASGDEWEDVGGNWNDHIETIYDIEVTADFIWLFGQSQAGNSTLVYSTDNGQTWALFREYEEADTYLSSASFGDLADIVIQTPDDGNSPTSGGYALLEDFEMTPREFQSQVVDEGKSPVLERLTRLESKFKSQVLVEQDYVYPVRIVKNNVEVSGLDPNLVSAKVVKADGTVVSVPLTGTEWEEVGAADIEGLYLLTVPASVTDLPGELLVIIEDVEKEVEFFDLTQALNVSANFDTSEDLTVDTSIFSADEMATLGIVEEPDDAEVLVYSGHGSAIRSYDETGSLVTTYEYDGQFSAGAFAVDPDGFLYGVVDVSNSHLFKWDSDGNEVWSELDSGNGVGEDLAVNPAGDVFVARNNKMSMVDSTGTESWDYDMTGISTPVAVAADDAGNSYWVVTRSDASTEHVLKIDDQGALVWAFDGLEAELSSDIAVDTEGFVYVSESEVVWILNDAGTSVSLETQFTGHSTTVNALEVDSQYLYSGEFGSPSWIKKTDKTDKADLVEEWSFDLWDHAEERPDRIEVDPLGNVYVSSTSSGGGLTKLNSSGTVDPDWNDPSGSSTVQAMAVDPGVYGAFSTDHDTFSGVALFPSVQRSSDGGDTFTDLYDATLPAINYDPDVGPRAFLDSSATHTFVGAGNADDTGFQFFAHDGTSWADFEVSNNHAPTGIHAWDNNQVWVSVNEDNATGEVHLYDGTSLSLALDLNALAMEIHQRDATTVFVGGLQEIYKLDWDGTDLTLDSTIPFSVGPSVASALDFHDDQFGVVGFVSSGGVEEIFYTTNGGDLDTDWASLTLPEISGSPIPFSNIFATEDSNIWGYDASNSTLYVTQNFGTTWNSIEVETTGDTLSADVLNNNWALVAGGDETGSTILVDTDESSSDFDTKELQVQVVEANSVTTETALGVTETNIDNAIQGQDSDFQNILTSLSEIKGSGFVEGTDALDSLRDAVDGVGSSIDFSTIEDSLDEIKGTAFVVDEDDLASIKTSVDGVSSSIDFTSIEDALDEIKGSSFDEGTDALDVLKDAVDGVSSSIDFTSIEDALDEIKGTGFVVDEDDLASIKAAVDAMGSSIDLSTIEQALDDIKGVNFDSSTDALKALRDELDLKATAAELADVKDKVSRVLGLSHENFRITDQDYNDNNQLIEAIIEIYDSATDLENQQNPQAVYRVETTYDIQGRVEDYRVLKITS